MEQLNLFTQFQLDEMERQSGNGTQYVVSGSGNWRYYSSDSTKRKRAKRAGRVAAYFHISGGPVCPDSKEEVI